MAERAAPRQEERRGNPVRGPRATAPRLASLDGSTPDQAYFTPLPFRMAAQPWQKLHLSDAENLFRQPGPLQFAVANHTLRLNAPLPALSHGFLVCFLGTF